MTLGKTATLAFLVILAVLLFSAMGALPETTDRMEAGGPTWHILRSAVPDTGAVNLVTAVLFDYRAFDTLGEATVIFTAVAGVVLVFAREAMVLSGKGLSPLAKKSMDILTPFIALLGFYVILFGHISPGGGFQGGVILASWAILVVLIYGIRTEEDVLTGFVKMFLESAGALLFVALGAVALIGGREFLSNLAAGFSPGDVGSVISAGSIPLLNVAIGLKVASGLAMMFVTMSKKDGDS